MPPPTTARSDSLFVDQAEDDEQWEPVNPDEEEEETGRLEWNATNEPVLFVPDPHLASLLIERQNPSSLRIGSYLSRQAEAQEAPPDRLASGLEPTQRLSDVCAAIQTRIINVFRLTGAGPPFWFVFSLTEAWLW